MVSKEENLNPNFLEYTVENFVHFIFEKNISERQLIQKIRSIDASDEKLSKVLQNVGFAYARINEPLDNSTRVLLVIIPFGIINFFLNDGFFNAEEHRKLGYIRKVREYFKYSLYGLFFYALILITSLLFFS